MYTPFSPSYCTNILYSIFIGVIHLHICCIKGANIVVERQRKWAYSLQFVVQTRSELRGYYNPQTTFCAVPSLILEYRFRKEI